MRSAIHTAHAAYALALSDEEWLSQLLSVMGPALDRGRGLVAFRWRHEAGTGVTPHELFLHGGRANDGPLLRQLLQNLDDQRAYLAYGAPYVYRPLSEIARAHPTIEQITDDVDMQRLAHGQAVVDFEMLRVDLAQGQGWMFAVLRDEVATLAPARRRLWERVAAHISAGARLRRQVDGEILSRADAVFDPSSGKIEALGDALDTPDRRARLLALIEARRHADRLASTDELGAMELWAALVDGRWSLLDVLDSDGRTFTVLHQNPIHVRSSVALSERERQVAYLAGRGHHSKLIAYELGLDDSTVRSQLSSALGKLNCDDQSALQRLVATVEQGDVAASLDDLGVLALRTTPLAFPDGLSAAEQAVARRVCDGWSNADIAKERGTSPRTVANQLAKLYRKLNVHSRAELVRRLSSR